MNVHVPKNADIVFLEYNQNDHGHVAMSSVQRRWVQASQYVTQ